ncbi:MAG: hypothetical protein A2Z38_05395 [Planctomycetes bacterium RBG_19FT_COMBO_48_8]|nr:MAG: hypothetical protein A2Z38_05395 [Planctomycetes bacterium RBG_19FT_COMBO_48_8]
MDEKEIRKIVEDTCNESKEDSIWSMASDFYSKMLSVVILVWIWAIIFIAGAVYCGIKFYETDQTKSQIMYAAIFVCCFEGICLMKIFAWQMIHRQGIKREIKKLRK